MGKEESNILDYIVICISEFASRYEMQVRDAYIYLSRNKGIEFLKEFYDVEHTLSFDDVLNDLVTICRKNGGAGRCRKQCGLPFHPVFVDHAAEAFCAMLMRR